MLLSDQDILDYIATHPGAGREDIRRGAARDASETTVWRRLKRLVDEKSLEVTGKGRATGYNLAGSNVIRAYLQTPYNRRKPVSYNNELDDRYIPDKSFYLDAPNRERLYKAGTPAGSPLPAGTYARRISERLLVDLSWASSRMEGNTYNILETERLIRFGEEATGKDRKEAVIRATDRLRTSIRSRKSLTYSSKKRLQLLIRSSNPFFCSCISHTYKHSKTSIKEHRELRPTSRC